MVSAGPRGVEVSCLLGLPACNKAHGIDLRAVGVRRVRIAVHLVLDRAAVDERHLRAPRHGQVLRADPGARNRDGRGGSTTATAAAAGSAGIRIAAPTANRRCTQTRARTPPRRPNPTQPCRTLSCFFLQTSNHRSYRVYGFRVECGRAGAGQMVRPAPPSRRQKNFLVMLNPMNHSLSATPPRAIAPGVVPSEFEKFS